VRYLTQPPLATLNRRCGSCRNIAVLIIEAVRWLGFAARIVSDYLVNRDEASVSVVGSAGLESTQAWAEIFVPGAGWTTFDPTNRTVGNFSLLPVAIARDIKQTVPVMGSFVSDATDFLRMTRRSVCPPVILAGCLFTCGQTFEMSET
jgi:transglutaminase-like putative cysteine protease